MPTLTTKPADKAPAAPPLPADDEPGSVTVFFVTREAETLVCAAFLGANQQAAGYAFALDWLATYYNFLRS